MPLGRALVISGPIQPPRWDAWGRVGTLPQCISLERRKTTAWRAGVALREAGELMTPLPLALPGAEPTFQAPDLTSQGGRAQPTARPRLSPACLRFAGEQQKASTPLDFLS